MIPYGRQKLDESDYAAVLEVLKCDYLTTGPLVNSFETKLAEYTGSKFAVAVSSGTAALHCAMAAIGIKEGDEVIVPAITFAATANSVIYQGGVPIFADVDADTLLINPEDVEKKITRKTKAIIGVDYAGLPCDWDKLQAICKKHQLKLIADSCHALGGKYKGANVGKLADISIFSFHAVKHIATGEGGMAVTDNETYASNMRHFRSHGITTDARQREANGAWYYEMTDLGFNYRITDIQCALGISQLDKLDRFLQRRNEIASIYDEALSNQSSVLQLAKPKQNNTQHAYHLYVIKVDPDKRDQLFQSLRSYGVGVNVHYIPVYLHPYYKSKFSYSEGHCITAEQEFKKLLSMPIWPGMSDSDVNFCIKGLMECLSDL